MVVKKIFSIFLFVLFLNSSVLASEQLHTKDEYKQAVKQYSKLIKKYPENWIFYYNRGMLFYEQGKDYTEYAYRDFKKASLLNPESEELKYNYLIMKEFRDARLNYALKAVGTAGLIGGAVGGQGVPKTMPKLKEIDTKVWETLNSTP